MENKKLLREDVERLVKEAREKNTRVNLSGVDLREVDLSRMDLRGVDFSKAYLNFVNFYETDLSKANLSGAFCFSANFNKAILNGANLSGTSLANADLSDANLSGANLSNANLRETKLSGANLKNANLKGVKKKRKTLQLILPLLFIGGLLCLGGFYGLKKMSDSSNYRQKVLEACREATTIADNSAGGPLGNVVIVDSSSIFSPGEIGLSEAKSIDEINTAVCIQEETAYSGTCPYEGGMSFDRLSIVWNVKVINWDTGQIRATNKFDGPIPASCPSSISSSGHGDIVGDPPSLSVLSDWLRKIETGTD
jgi:uncharacterized protein YjbI with pentapeptide repeats